MTSPDYFGAPSDRTPAASGLSRRWLALLIAVALVVGVGGTVLILYSTGAFSTEIRAEPIQDPGDNPFMPPVGRDQPNVTPPPGTGRMVPGNAPGLYGGTLNNSSCDPQAMVAFLQANPDKAAAWASVQGITPADIPAYVAELTPVILRSETAVTNHGFANGKATTVHSVLQPGTAVLVDKFGVPRTRCYCGNPLTSPTLFSKPRYVGQVWPSFSQTNITIIQPVTIAINEFIIVNPITNVIIYRPAGTRGESDRGDLQDASITGEYTLSRRVITCDGLTDGCSTSPIQIRISCSDSQCTIERLDGVWVQSHTLTRNGTTWRTSGPDEGATYCRSSDQSPPAPVPGTSITFELTVTSAATINGFWRAQNLRATYMTTSPAVAGTNCGPGKAVYELSN